MIFITDGMPFYLISIKPICCDFLASKQFKVKSDMFNKQATIQDAFAI